MGSIASFFKTIKSLNDTIREVERHTSTMGDRTITAYPDRIITQEQDGRDNTLVRSVEARGDTVIIASYTKDAHSHELAGTASSTSIKAPEVAQALHSATSATLQDRLSPKEAEQLEKLRQDVARYGTDDGRYDAQESQAIATRAQRTGRGLE